MMPPSQAIDCEQCFDELDRYVDLELAGVDAEARVPGMRAPTYRRGCSRPTVVKNGTSGVRSVVWRTP